MKYRYTPFMELLLAPLLIALFFSAFIYWEHFALTSKALNTFSGLIALYALLHAPKRTVLISGFWIGLLWCYWIGFSFQYYGLGWATWLVALGFGIVYSLYYGTMALTSNPFIRALVLFALTFVWPMDFNWMQPELIFVESYLGFAKWQFALVLFSLALSGWFSGFKKLFPLMLLLGAIQTSYATPPLPDVKIKLVSTDISQDFKWQNERLEQTLQENFDAIDDAIAQGYDLVVLPESAFPLYMNEYAVISEALAQRSMHIAILTGTLHKEDGLNYNVSYLYNEGNVTIAKKTILVPFGEYIPLPEFLRGWVNREIFGGGADFVTAEKPTDFNVKGATFRNAVCYEATRSELYTPEVRYIIAVSNNGWFKPSIEPTVQNLLIRFYARKNNTIVFHAANGGGSGIVY
ncbi:apolipoprotein N-acyltransferase [Sulfuricurvum sp. RIFCSPLOWO2_12_FULL_43_24]|uniref:apolipoprotein N-acyltransferase n=1 Tax=Sulfuricurvum sp. RIFCSPLOWO2_12_FULL_43_24 TaxID=1802247 RepID=UPI0008B96389|nr:apolipoprotein N-acyltransferase [Sulfuricurvum sp. RIFCSPLOWO2_12_FULL_43_24]OHD88451.1 MAG: apolipoprotein N-acyltransferase [Sulfuricurvum sp. RIFCSPLOWO2_12_FULL_43_24]